MSFQANWTDQPTPTQASARQWLGLAILALPCLLYSMDLTVLNLAVPHIIADLGPTGSQLLWIIDIYGFLLAGALVTMGAIGDRIGRRKLLLIGAIAFGAASAAAAYANSAEMLIAARAALGLAAATLAPSTLSLIRTMFHNEGQRSFAIGVWMASFSLGGALGPLVGGALLEHFWWGSLFLIALPVMALLLVAGPLVLPEHKAAQAGPPDGLSVLLSIAGMLLLVFAVKHLAIGDFSWPTISALILGAMLAWLFVSRQRRLETPLVALDLFVSPGFSGALVVNLTGFFVAFSTLLFLSQYLQLVLGMGPFEAGLWTLCSATGFVVGSLFSPALLRWLTAQKIMGFSLWTAALGFVLLAYALGSGSFTWLMIGALVFSLGLSPVFTLSADVIVGSAPERKAGAAAALAETSSELGGALGIAVLGSLVASVYRMQMGGAEIEGVSTQVLQGASDSIGAAVALAQDLASDQASLILVVSEAAFSQAFIWAALAAALLAMGTGILALRLAK